MEDRRRRGEEEEETRDKELLLMLVYGNILAWDLLPMLVCGNTAREILHLFSWEIEKRIVLYGTDVLKWLKRLF